VRIAYRILVRNPEGKRPLGRPRHEWEIILDWILGKQVVKVVDWIHLGQDEDQLHGVSSITSPI
jgi:hypothetical protein